MYAVNYFYRGRCPELISYWQFVAADKNTMAQLYFTILLKYIEVLSLWPLSGFCYNF
jgi:hypothetical protein